MVLDGCGRRIADGCWKTIAAAEPPCWQLITTGGGKPTLERSSKLDVAMVSAELAGEGVLDQTIAAKHYARKTTLTAMRAATLAATLRPHMVLNIM